MMSKSYIKKNRDISFSSDFIGKPYLISNKSLRTMDWSREFDLLDSCVAPVETHLRLESIHASSQSDEYIFWTDNLIDKNQCGFIKEKCSVHQQQDIVYNGRRNNTRLIVFDDQFANYLSLCLLDHLRNQLAKFHDDKIYPLGFDVLRGKWELNGVNKAIRFNSYDGSKKEKFEKHRDAQFCPSGDHRSFLSLVIYLNDDFEGGETKFYIPKQRTYPLEINLCDTSDQEQYDVISVKPRAGSAVLFSQNILHESAAVTSSRKCILKTDIMLKRSQAVGFQVSEAEREDYFSCLNLFRQAQQLELSKETDCSEAYNLYDKCLSLRYSYPGVLLAKGHSARKLLAATTEQLTEERKESLNKSHNGDCSYLSGNLIADGASHVDPLDIFPQEVWEVLLSFVCIDISANNLVTVFPSLKKIKEKQEERYIVPSAIYNCGVFSHFTFLSPSFCKLYVEDCCRVLAVYSIFLLGQNKSDQTYVVNYNPRTNEAVAIPLRKLLLHVFYKTVSYGALYKVYQQSENQKDPLYDLLNSVTRDYMIEKYQQEFFGVDITSDVYGEIRYLGSSYSDDESEDEVDVNRQCKDKTTPNDFRSCVARVRYLDRLHQASYGFIFQSENATLLDTEDNNLKKHERSDDLFSYKQSLSCYIEDCYYENKERQLVRQAVTQNVPSALIVRKLKNLVRVKSETCICFARNVNPNLSESLETVTFNHFIADFSMQTFEVRECQFKNSSKDGDDLDMMLFYLLRKVTNDIGMADTGKLDCRAFVVNISSLKETGLGFNHAGCQCGSLMFQVDEYFNVQNYPILDNISIVLKESKNKMLGWTCYGGVAAL